MTVELAVCIPLLVAVAIVGFNAMLFLENCAAFDRLAKEAVRTCAATPAHGQSVADGAALTQAALSASFSEPYLDVSVDARSGTLGFVTYTATLRFAPTLFGRSFSGVAFGTGLGFATHSTSIVVDPYRPGVVL